MGQADDCIRPYLLDLEHGHVCVLHPAVVVVGCARCYIGNMNVYTSPVHLCTWTDQPFKMEKKVSCTAIYLDKSSALDFFHPPLNERSLPQLTAPHKKKAEVYPLEAVHI